LSLALSKGPVQSSSRILSRSSIPLEAELATGPVDVALGLAVNLCERDDDFISHALQPTRQYGSPPDHSLQVE
jgi:hypothetical protein